MKIAKWLIALVVCLLLTAGCGSSESSKPTLSNEKLYVGQKLRQADGSDFGTIVKLSDSHRFENGDVEPGALVDYGPRMSNPPVPPQWLPQRSVRLMAR